MIRESSPAMLAATAIVSLAIGFGASSLLPRPPGVIEPIIDADAWQETSSDAFAPEPMSFTTRGAIEKCDPWKVSDIAMEEVLDQMIRRGWRPPSQGEAIALLDTAATKISATEPNAPMPSRLTWTSSIVRDDEAIGDEDEITENPVAAEPAAPPAEPERPAPPPA